MFICMYKKHHIFNKLAVVFGDRGICTSEDIYIQAYLLPPDVINWKTKKSSRHDKPQPGHWNPCKKIRVTVCLWELMNWVFWPLSLWYLFRFCFKRGTIHIWNNWQLQPCVGKKVQTGSGNLFEQTWLIILLFYDHYPQLQALAELWNCSMFLQNRRKPAVGWTKWAGRGRSGQIWANNPAARF